MIRLDDLFRATQDIDLPEGQKGMARALTDAEAKERRRFALVKSQEVVEELKDPTSLRHRLSVAPLEKVKDDEADSLIKVILEARRYDSQRDAVTLFPLPFIPIADDADDVTEREVLQQREESEKVVREQRAEYVKQRITTLREKYQETPMETLRVVTRQLAITVEARRTMVDAFRWYTIYASVFIYNNGKAERLFQSPDQVANVPSSIVDRLYKKAEAVDNVDPWDIVKNA